MKEVLDMGLFQLIAGLFGKKSSASTLRQDIDEYSEWIMTALNRSGYLADYTLESMKELDRFINTENNGIIAGNRGLIIFAMGAYVGKTVIKLYGGDWITDDHDLEGELNIKVKLPDGTEMAPVQKCLKRCKLGMEESLYSYVSVIPMIMGRQ